MPRRYSAVAIILHWMIATAIICQLALGLYMTRLGNNQIELKFVLYQLHKSVGITVLALSLLRLLWRLIHRPPPLPAHQPSWERVAADSLHILFYIFLIGMPVSGWIIVSTSPYNIPTVLYGIIPLPDIPFLSGLSDKAAISIRFSEIHEIAAYILIGAVALHIAAALKHQFLNRDEILWRMIPLALLNPYRRDKS